VVAIDANASRRLVHRLLRGAAPLLKLLGWAGGVLLAPHARAVELPDDRAEAMVHLYKGGGVDASGPALLVRKSVADKFSLSGSLYVDVVSNASIDVVTTASPYREQRTEFGLGVDHVVRDALIHIGVTRSSEPDYKATLANVDVSQEVFGGMTTVSLGFSRGRDDVGKQGDIGFFDGARHRNWRLGATQVLTPRWVFSANAEQLADLGYLGSPYRVAQVFGSVVPERVPRTRTAQALKLRLIGDIGEAGTHSAVRAEYRYYHDTWAIKAHTLEAGYSRYFGSAWLADAFVRMNRQSAASFYSDNASTESLFITRNRQLSSFTSNSLGAKVAYTLAGAPAGYDVKLNAAYELVRFRYKDYTDIRTGSPYGFTGHVLQLYVTAKF